MKERDDRVVPDPVEEAVSAKKKNELAREWRDLCRFFIEEGGAEELFRLAQDRDPRVRLEALRLIVAYAHGKPTNTIQVEQSTPTHVVVDLVPAVTETKHGE
jgi:HEAT repeat protein